MKLIDKILNYFGYYKRQKFSPIINRTIEPIKVSTRVDYKFNSQNNNLTKNEYDEILISQLEDEIADRVKRFIAFELNNQQRYLTATIFVLPRPLETMNVKH